MQNPCAWKSTVPRLVPGRALSRGWCLEEHSPEAGVWEEHCPAAGVWEEHSPCGWWERQGWPGEAQLEREAAAGTRKTLLPV